MTCGLTPSLVRLRAQINEKFPKGDRSSDGWIDGTVSTEAVQDGQVLAAIEGLEG